MKNTERLADDLTTVVQNAQDILSETGDSASEKARTARKGLVTTLESAKAYCKTLQRKTVAGAKATDKTIRDHPYQTAGVALGVGILVGYLLKRKNHVRGNA